MFNLIMAENWRLVGFLLKKKKALLWPARSNGVLGSQSGLLTLARHNDFGVCALRGRFCFYRIFA